jgi:hypothetical protein
MSSIRDRLLQVIDLSGLSPRELEQQTGVDRYIWQNVKAKKQRVNEDHLEAVFRIWPQFAYWIATGQTMPEAGQISPDMEK